MTNRFTMGDRVLQEVYAGCIPAILDGGIPCTQSQVLKLLNELHKENEELKQALRELKEIGDYQADRIKELQEFEDKVFDSLNNKIKMGEKAIEWGESSGADVGAMGFHIESLKQFKKELEE